MPHERHKRVTDDGVLRRILQVVATEFGSQIPSGLQDLAAPCVMLHGLLFSRFRKKQASPREGHECVADDGIHFRRFQRRTTYFGMKRIDMQYTVASPRTDFHHFVRGGFFENHSAPDKRHQRIANGCVCRFHLNIRAAEFRMKRIDASFNLAVIFVLVNNLIRGVFVENSVVPSEGHKGVTDGDFIEFIDSFRAAYFGRQMERFTHRTAVEFGLDIHAIGGDAKAVPPLIGQFDGVERQVQSCLNIYPFVAVERQTVRCILPKVVIRGFETAIGCYLRFKNIR